MSILSSKWVLGLVILLVTYLAVWFIGKKSVVSEIRINTTSALVWEALTDAEQVRKWNSVLIPADGNIQEGSKITYEFYQEENGKAAVMDAQVIQLIYAELINQKGGIPSVLTFDHRYIISSNDSSTTVKIREVYRGVMVPFWNPIPVEKAYDRLLVQLKTHLENE